MAEDSEGSGTVISRDYCEDCGSHDNLVTYADGHRWCYSPQCGKKSDAEWAGEDTPQPPSKARKNEPMSTAIPYTEEYTKNGFSSRCVKLETTRKFGYFVAPKNGGLVQVAPIYDQSGRLVYQKFRGPNKEFWFEPVVENPPPPGECRLYGMNVFGEGNDKKVIIIEGEWDCHSVAEASKFKVPVHSLVQGIGSAVKSLKANYKALDKYEEVILWFDNDEPGQSVIDECAALFAPGKVKTIKVEGYKDASDMKKDHKDGDIYKAIYAATTWQPQGIVNAADCLDDLDEPQGRVIAPYPWPLLQEHTMGILAKEVVYHVAGTGVGKTTITAAIQHHAIKSVEDVKIGIMRFEDDRAKVQWDLMGVEAKKRLHLDPPDKATRAKLHTAVFGKRQVELFDPETADWSLDAILSYCRYMAKGLDCDIIFIDPLSFVVAGSPDKDERKALDNVAYEFSKLVKQMDVNLQICHHLKRVEGRAHEEGGEISISHLRGSGGIANFSMSIFGYERNQQGDRPDLARIRIAKNRFVGWTGIADVMKYDDLSGLYFPTDEPYPEAGGDKPAFPPMAQEEGY